MINRIRLIRNIGQFDNVTPPPDTAFTPLSLVYAENARGKTTLAAIFRSLATGNEKFVTERHRLGAQHPPHIVIDHTNGQSVFQNRAWTETLPEIQIFDDAFVSANVCSGIQIQTAHRQSLHELILGSQGVTLNDALQRQVTRIERHNAALRGLEVAIPTAARGPYGIDAYCALKVDPDIDGKILDVERRLAAARSADVIQKRPVFREIILPDFDMEVISGVLRRTLADLDEAAAARVRNHIGKLGRGGEAWVADGTARIAPVSEGLGNEVCPFCTQDIGGRDLIVNYRAYFSQEYENLKTAIRQAGEAVTNMHGGDIPAAFERDVRTAVQVREFWKDFTELPAIEIDTAAIARNWNTARDSVLAQLRAKADAPLEHMTLAPETRHAILSYRESISPTSATQC